MGGQVRGVELADELRASRSGSMEAQVSLLAAIVDSPDYAIISQTLDGTVITWNRGAEAIYGYTADEIVGKPFSVLVDDERPDEITEIRQETPGHIEHRETVRLRDDGSPMTLSLTVSPIRDAGGTIVGASSIAHDISRSTVMQSELAEARSLLDSILRSSIKYSMIGKDLEHRIVSWNEGACRNYGYTAEEVIGRSSQMLHSRRELESGAVERLLARALDEGLAEGDFERVRKDGSHFIASVVVSRRTDAAGHHIGYLVMSSDITAQKMAEEQAKAVAEAATRELEAFSYSVAHDLRAPLRGISGFGQALLEDCAEKLDADGKRYLTHIREAAQQMGGLIDDLLDLSRVTATELRREVVDLSSLARTVLRRLSDAEPERAIELVIQDGLSVYGDAHLLDVVLTNLLGNAWKFTRGSAAPRIELGQLRLHGALVFFVRDNGAGFDPAFVDKLFGVFQRLHSAEEFEGSGIGLATVQRVIRRHGGKVWGEAQVGVGATFYFKLEESSDAR